MKVVFRKTKYRIDEKSKKVICTMSATIKLTNRQNNVQCWPVNTNLKSVGIAKCHEEDMFDPEKGKRLAESRAKRKIYEKGKNELANILKYVDIFGEDVQNQLEKLKRYHKKEKEHQVELMSENSDIAEE